MSEPTYALQVAQAAALLAATSVTDLVGQSVFDDLSAPDSVYPRICLGDDQDVSDDNDCGDASYIYSTIHVWARGADARLVAKQICGVIKPVLAPPSPFLTLTGFTMGSARRETTQHMWQRDPSDPDGLIAHSVPVFRYRITATS